MANAKHLPIHWRIFSIAVALGALLYFQQRSLSVAGERIMPALSLSQMQLGWLQWAFIVSYSCLQFPGGLYGQRFGARRVLSITGVVAVAALVIVPLAPTLLSGTALFAVLLTAQFALGAAHAPFFPVSAGVFEAWLPTRRWALAVGLQTFACQIGAAVAPPIIVFLMQAFGWQRALFWSALPGLGLIALWAWYGRNTPHEHTSVSAEELAKIGHISNLPHGGRADFRRIRHLLVQRDICLLTLSYVCMNYVFYLISNWTFLYLVQERHFTLLQSGWLASLPPLGAALGAGIGGGLTDFACARVGLRWGYRLVPLTALPAAAALLLFAVYGNHVYSSVIALTLCFMAIELTEGAYWASAMRVAQADTMAATGLLNTGGAGGGVVGIPIVAYLSGHHAWNGAFVGGVIFAIVAAFAWLGIDATRSAVSEFASYERRQAN